MDTFREFLRKRLAEVHADGVRLDRDTRTDQVRMWRQEWTGEVFRMVHDRREKPSRAVLESARRTLPADSFGHLMRYLQRQ